MDNKNTLLKYTKYALGLGSFLEPYINDKIIPLNSRDLKAIRGIDYFVQQIINEYKMLKGKDSSHLFIHNDPDLGPVQAFNILRAVRGYNFGGKIAKIAGFVGVRNMKEFLDIEEFQGYKLVLDKIKKGELLNEEEKESSKNLLNLLDGISNLCDKVFSAA
ncbi:MAG: hypothetical protein ABIH65_03710 [Nanoarchaeota archaeon]